MSNEIHVAMYLLDGVGNNTRGGRGGGLDSEPLLSRSPNVTANISTTAHL